MWDCGKQAVSIVTTVMWHKLCASVCVGQQKQNDCHIQAGLLSQTFFFSFSSSNSILGYPYLKIRLSVNQDN